MANDNRTLGRFILDGIPPAPRGIPQIEVTFDIDTNGILTVKAKDKASGREQHITIRESSKLSEEEIKRMQKEAEEFAAEDRKKKELIDLHNQADAILYTAEKTLKDYQDKIKPENKSEVEEKVKNLKEAKEKDEAESIKKAMEELNTALSKIGSDLYSQEQEKNKENKSEDKPNEEKKEDEGPIEGEYTE
jgi:molecular chaperone DnaK